MAEHVGWFRSAPGSFMLDHRIGLEAIPPFFVIMATVMVASRVAMLQVRFGRPGRVPVPAPQLARAAA